MHEIVISGVKNGRLPFSGIGAEADAYIFDEANRSLGMTDADFELVERRIGAVRPALSRMFVELEWFNPSLDGTSFKWDGPGYVNLVRQLRLLRKVGTSVNLVLFKPLPKLDANMEPAVRAILAFLERLAGTEGVDNVRWLTLWNEPDSLFFHDSPLYRSVFGEDSITKRPPWSEYVRLNRIAYEGLKERGLYPRTKMLVADTVWGAPMRLERMRMSLEAFDDLDVSYGYHNYSTEQLSFYKGNVDFAYSGMAAEAATFRDMLGPDRELILWEFNTVGLSGFGTYFLGVGPGGVDQVSSFAGAVDLSGKVLCGAANGVDGFCIWCMHDMLYCGEIKTGVMPCGLWRFRNQNWLPRPIYHYYALLCRSFRPGAQILNVECNAEGIVSLAVRDEGKIVVALLNQGGTPAKVSLRGIDCKNLSRSRVYPSIIPVESDLPFSEEQTLSKKADAIIINLEIDELTVLRK